MKKITELTETGWRTVHHRDVNGNYESFQKKYSTIHTVKSIPIGLRIGHFIIDLNVFLIICYVLASLYEILINYSNFSRSLLSTLSLSNIVVLILLYPMYYAYCVYKWQRTVGKFLSNTVVIDEYGNKPELRSIVLRSLIRLVPFEPISHLVNKFSHGWHDKWSETWVVTEEELEIIKKLQATQSGTI